jgi:hypothetical protein
MTGVTGLLAAGLAVLVACTPGGGSDPAAAPTPTGSGAPGATSSAPPTVEPSDTDTAPTPGSPTEPAGTFDARAAMADVRALAALGPREATSTAYSQAADLVAARLTALGYDVTRERFRVPEGVSWGVPVPAGRSSNVVARLPGGTGDGRPVLVGAHLDTVPQAPGAEDNASGVAVLLELARLAAAEGTARPVTFVAFGAEEPRGPGDDGHHYGSRVHVDRGGTPRPAAVVSLDRVGAPGRVPVCTGGLSPLRVRRGLLAAADRVGVPARACVNRTSDHWPFERAGRTVARVGGNEYAAYHSAGDRPRAVSRRQIDRVGRTVWEWLRTA